MGRGGGEVGGKMRMKGDGDGEREEVGAVSKLRHILCNLPSVHYYLYFHSYTDTLKS